MGTGIAAAIPIALKKSRYYEPSEFSEKFWDGYILDSSSQIYRIKEELLVDNYQPFLKEFYDLIGEPEDLMGRAVPAVVNFNDFSAVFDGGQRNMKMPFIDYSTIGFSFLGGESSFYWLFYSGSYKAYLETYKTLLHFERILSKTMKNPLANFIKFGIFG
jgi:hypothetical protein